MATGDQNLAAMNRRNQSIGSVEVLEAHTPKLGGRPTRIAELKRDRKGRFYAEYYADGGFTA